MRGGVVSCALAPTPVYVPVSGSLPDPRECDDMHKLLYTHSLSDKVPMHLEVHHIGWRLNHLY